MIVVAKESFVTTGKRRVRAGELFDDSHELVRKLGNLFEPYEGVVRDAGVESATAAPGEKRSTTSRSTRKADV